MDLGKWRDKAKEVVDKAKAKAESTGLAAKLQGWVDGARAHAQAANESESAARIKELVGIAQTNAQEMTDNAAVRIAALWTEHTGRETTPEEVKRVAIRVGTAALIAAVIAMLFGAVGDFGGGELGDVGGGAADAGGYEGFDDSFESNVNEFFADKGGINIETHVVDMDGCMLS